MRHAQGQELQGQELLRNKPRHPRRRAGNLPSNGRQTSQTRSTLRCRHPVPCYPVMALEKRFGDRDIPPPQSDLRFSSGRARH